MALSVVLVLVWGSSACALVPQATAAPAQIPAPQTSINPPQTIEMTRSCAVENGLWVCRYQPPASIIAADPVPVSPSTVLMPQPGAVAPAADPQRAEEARLMVRCSAAGWLSLCTPSERREARRLRQEADRREALRREVTGLLARNDCEAAARTALEGADMALALEARTYCARPATTP